MDVTFHCEAIEPVFPPLSVTLSETLIVLAALVSLPVCRLLPFHSTSLSLSHTHTHTVQFCCWKDDSSEYASTSTSFCECFVSGKDCVCFLLILLILDCYRSLPEPYVPYRALTVFISALVDYLCITIAVTCLDTPTYSFVWLFFTFYNHQNYEITGNVSMGMMDKML